MRSSEDHTPRHAVLIASSTSLIREVFHDIFAAANYECLLAGSGREAIEIVRGWQPSLIVADFNLEDMTALELLQDLRQDDPDIAFIILCGDVFKRNGNVVGLLDSDAVRAAGLKLGAHTVLEKPVRPRDVLLAADQAIESRRVALCRRQPLEHQWREVRPMAGASELLAMFAAVFSVPSKPKRDRTRPVEIRGPDRR
jgi:CheY-like chemotaxis protein